MITERKEGPQHIIWINDGLKFSKFNDRHQTTKKDSSNNTKQHKYQIINNEAYHIETAENQRQKKILKKSDGRKTPSLLRNKDSNHKGFLIRSHANKK